MTLVGRLYRPMISRGIVSELQIKHGQKVFFGPFFNARQRVVSLRRAKISACVPSAQIPPGKVIARADGPTSLAWRQLHDQSPASYGIQAFDGYLELIPAKIPLPCEKSETMESALDYIRSVSFGICCRRTLLNAHVEIAEDAVLHNIRPGKEGEVKFKVTMRMGKDLIGNFTAQDTWTRSKVSIDFDGGKVFQTRPLDHALITRPP